MEFAALHNLDELLTYPPEPTPIPKEKMNQQKAIDASSRAAKAQKMIAALRGTHQELKKGVKRKVSDIASAPLDRKKGEAEELLNIVIEQRGNLQKLHKASKESLLEQFNCGVLPEPKFFEELRDVQNKERKLFAGDVTIDRNRERVLRNIQGLVSQNKTDEWKAGEHIAAMFLNILAHKAVDRKSEQKLFRQDLISHYECQPEGWKTEIWCPIFGDWFDYKNVKAAHLVPYKLGYQTLGDLFGEETRGHELMWSMGNGLMMHKDLERAFDEHVFCLVPVEKPGQPDGWKMILIKEEMRFKKLYGPVQWDYFDGRELQFRNDQRPSRRFLYFHYFLCVYRTMQERTPGWQKAREKSGTRQLWATPGPYLRISMLKKLAELIGDETELPEKLLLDGERKDVKPLKEATEVLDAKDLMSALVENHEFKPPKSDEDPELEDSEYSDYD